MQNKLKHHQVCYQKNHNSNNKKDTKNGKQMDNKHMRVTLQLEVCSICRVVINANQLQIEQLPITVSLACVYSLIIYMKKFLHSDWLRAVQFFFKTVQKRVNSVQKEETNQAF